eukprot:2529191-Pyramimonas_sp.AAC.1
MIHLIPRCPLSAGISLEGGSASAPASPTPGSVVPEHKNSRSKKTPQKELGACLKPTNPNTVAVVLVGCTCPLLTRGL